MSWAPEPSQAAAGCPLDFASLTREAILRGRAALRARHDAGAPGREIVRAYTLLVDRLIWVLFTAATEEFVTHPHRVRHRCTLMAQGGYGRRELSPFSDIDLVFLYPLKLTPYVEQIAQRILYGLWDTGIVVGHALHNPRSCLRLAERDFKVKTSLLDARYVSGDVELFYDFKEGAQTELLSKNGRRFVEEKLAESAARHRRYGDSIYVLQPELKEGEGGLRDLHTVLWLAKVKFKIQRLRDLVTLGIITDRELTELELSQDFLWRIRNALHFSSGAHQDRLTFEYQESIAAELGYQDTDTERGLERFMRLYYLHAAVVNRFSEMVIDRCLEGTRAARLRPSTARRILPGMQIRADALSVTGPTIFRRDPANLIQVFAQAQRHGAVLSRATKRLVREHLYLARHNFQGNDRAVAAFFDILRSRTRVYETLHEMHKQGVLIRFIPEFANVLCRVQRDLYHIYTVDEHSLRCILELERLRAGEYAHSSPLLTQVMREDDKTEILFLAMLFHDIGKGHGHGHSERGADLAREIAVRFRLDGDDVAQLEFLVRYHLLMSHLAYRRDIHDDDLVLNFVKQVGNLSSLRKLYLLTFADMKAVGPNFWNNWRDMLLGELYIRALQIFEMGGRTQEERGARTTRVMERLRRRFQGGDQRPGCERFLATMPVGYFARTPEERIPADIVLVERLRRAAEDDATAVQTDLKHFPDWEYSEFTICTADRPGLFFMLAGVLAAAGLNVVGARITTSSDGVALDEFRVSHVGSRETVLEAGRWERVQRSLEEALRGERDVEAMVAGSRRPTTLAGPQRGLTRPGTVVVVDNDVSADHTVLDIYTEDRVGVLFVIAGCLYRLGLRIHLAKITTNVAQVLDVFYVTDDGGGKIADIARLEMIKAQLTETLRGDAEGATGNQGSTGG